MQKEILTKEACILDLLETQRYPKFRGYLLTALLILAGAFALSELRERLYYRNSASFDTLFLVYAIAAGAVLFLTVALYLLRTLYIARQRRKIKNGAFRIEEDKLIRVRQGVPCPKISVPGKRDKGLRDLLVFEKHGEFYLQYYSYYKWSPLYPMNAEDVFRSSGTWDSFYLAVFTGDRRENVLMVYNTKMFDFKESE